LKKLFLNKPFRLQPILDIMAFIAATAFEKVIGLSGNARVVLYEAESGFGRRGWLRLILPLGLRSCGSVGILPHISRLFAFFFCR
jgi:hypothetical protein